MMSRRGTCVLLLAGVMMTSGRGSVVKAAGFLDAIGPSLEHSTKVVACQDCSDDQLPLAALDAAALGTPFMDRDRDHLVYVVDPVSNVIRSFRYIQTVDGIGASAQVKLADGSDEERQAIREVLDYFHEITAFNEIHFSDLPRSDRLEFDSALRLAVHEDSRREVEDRIRRYAEEHLPFKTGGSRIKNAALGALLGLLIDDITVPSENNEVRVKFPDGSSWAFEIESFNLEITDYSIRMNFVSKEDGGRDPAGNQIFRDSKASIYERNIEGSRALIRWYVELADALKMETDSSALAGDAETYRLRCEDRRDPPCIVQAL